MARVCRGAAAVLSLLTLSMLGSACAELDADRPATPPGLYDRPVLVVDPGMHTAGIRAADADAAGVWGVTGSDDKTVRVWSLADGRLERTIRLPAGLGNVGKVFAVAISPDGRLIAAGGWTRWTDARPQEQIYLFDRATGLFVRPPIEGLPSVVIRLVFSPDGQRLAATLGAGGLRVYDRARGWDEIGRDEAYGHQSNGASFAPDGRLATTSFDGEVRLYGSNLVGSLKPLLAVSPPGGRLPLGLAFSPDGTRIAVGYLDSLSIGVLNSRTLAGSAGSDTSGGDDLNLVTVAWSRDGRTLFAGGTYERRDTPVLAWGDGGVGRPRELAAARQTVMGLNPLPNGDLLVASADPALGRLGIDGRARWWDRSPVADFRGQAAKLAVSNDGARLDFRFTNSADALARFDLAQHMLRLGPLTGAGTVPPRQTGLAIEGWRDTANPTLDGYKLPMDANERARSLAIHPAVDRFVLGSEWWLRAFDTNGALLWHRPTPGPVWAVNITGDGRLVVAAYGDGTIRWHRMRDGAELLAFMPLANRTDWVAWTPEGFYDATPGAEGMLRWQVNHGWQPAESLPVTAIPGSRRPDLLPLVLHDLQTPPAEVLAHAQQVTQGLHSALPPGAHF